MSVGIRYSSRARGLWLRVLAAALVLAAGGAVFLWWSWIHWSPARGRYPIQGVGISSNNGEVDWPTLRTRGVDFAYIRVVTGQAKRDPAFAANWGQAREAGLRYGAELVYDPCVKAGDQGTLFMTTVPRDNAALPPAIRLDFPAGCAIRPTRDSILSELNTLINLIEAHSGKPVLLHVSRAFDAAYDIGGGINRTLWLDGNFFPPDYAARPWVMWAASDARRIAGVKGPVEWDVVAP